MEPVATAAGMDVVSAESFSRKAESFVATTKPWLHVQLGRVNDQLHDIVDGLDGPMDFDESDEAALKEALSSLRETMAKIAAARKTLAAAKFSRRIEEAKTACAILSLTKACPYVVAVTYKSSRLVYGPHEGRWETSTFEKAFSVPLGIWSDEEMRVGVLDPMDPRVVEYFGFPPDDSYDEDHPAPMIVDAKFVR